MLWREPYTPRLLSDIAVPPLSMMPLYPGADSPGPKYALIAGFSLWAIGEMGIWHRLFLDGGFQSATAFIDQDWSPKAIQELGDSVPSSSHRNNYVISDPDALWRQLIEPDKPERSFAAIIRDEVAERVVVGPPTEDVWEEFARRLSQL